MYSNQRQKKRHQPWCKVHKGNRRHPRGGGRHGDDSSNIIFLWRLMARQSKQWEERRQVCGQRAPIRDTTPWLQCCPCRRVPPLAAPGPVPPPSSVIMGSCARTYTHRRHARPCCPPLLLPLPPPPPHFPQKARTTRRFQPTYPWYRTVARRSEVPYTKGGG